MPLVGVIRLPVASPLEWDLMHLYTIRNPPVNLTDWKSIFISVLTILAHLTTICCLLCPCQRNGNGSQACFPDINDAHTSNDVVVCDVILTPTPLS